ncbi:HTH DNA binding protein [Rhodococcus phage ChewyVIII]|uniref:HTH DNA binding protein n=1 Tax=Rhodococcus phage ChewyVIII TaxID=1887657 RepID=A0A1C9EI18_9CAUD|nr:HTH DNA binding protein [Rhodococcus phage ChewyVIII]AON97439.1 HTH DNA binding protein [Rhodococcus phage ChewyVIII]
MKQTMIVQVEVELDVERYDATTPQYEKKYEGMSEERIYRRLQCVTGEAILLHLAEYGNADATTTYRA